MKCKIKKPHYRRGKCGGKRKYDLGKIPTTGYQRGNQVNVAGFTSQRGEDINPMVQETRANILPNTISQGFNYYGLGQQMLNGASTITTPMFTPNAAAFDALSKAMTPKISWGIGQNGAFSASLNVPANTNNIPIEPLLTNTGSKTSHALNALGKSASIAGMALGGINLYKGFSDYGNYRQAGDIMNAMSKNTQTYEGVDATTYGGLNSSAELDYVKAQNKASMINNVLSGAGTGFSAGMLTGNPLIGGIGAGIGALISGIGSIFGGNSRKKKVEQAVENAQLAADNYNKQAISEAASEGLRNKYNESHTGVWYGDCGKDRKGGMKKYNRGKISDYTNVWTPAGEQYGPVNSMVGKGESLIDYDNGKASYVDKGKRRVDNQPSIAAPGDNIVIAGNDIDITNGRSFADQAAPYTQMIEQLQAKEDKINRAGGSNNTRSLNLNILNAAKQEAFSKLKPITDRQQMQHELLNTKEGVAKYNSGKIDFLSVAPYLAGMMAPLSQYNHYRKMVPTAENAYVGNANARQALNILGGLRFDPYNQVNAVRNAYRQGLYNINQAGALTGGQRLAMLSQQNNNYMSQLANIYGNANDINAKYKQAFAQALLSSGAEDRQYKQQALTTQQEAYRQAVARKRQGIESGMAGMLQIGNTLAKNLWDQKQFGLSQDYNNAIINLYNQQAALDKVRLNNDVEQARQKRQIKIGG